MDLVIDDLVLSFVLEFYVFGLALILGTSSTTSSLFSRLLSSSTSSLGHTTWRTHLYG
jgi:hypothetical protein